MMNIIIPFLVFFFFAMAFKLALSKESNKRRRSFEQILYDEQQANFKRARAIPQEALIKPNIDFLRDEIFDTYPAEVNDTTISIFNKIKSNILEKGTGAMMKIDPLLSNKGLKEQFGVANLESIINAEENYYNYIHDLNTYGEMLIKHSMTTQSEKVMEHCVYEMKSNIIKSYTTLNESYKENNATEKIEQLKQYVNRIETFQDEIELKGKLIELFK